MATSNDSARRETLRHAVLEVLASRHPVALGTEGIKRRIEQGESVDGPVDLGEIDGALEFLLSAELVQLIPGALGASKHWRATATGVLQWERCR